MGVMDFLPGIWRERLAGACLGFLLGWAAAFTMAGGFHADPKPVHVMLPDGGVGIECR